MYLANPSDTDLIRPAVFRLRPRFERPPKPVISDRRLLELTIETDLRDLGITDVVIARTGKTIPSQASHHTRTTPARALGAPTVP